MIATETNHAGASTAPDAAPGEPRTGVHRLSFAEYCRLDAVNWHTLEPLRKSALYARHAKLTQADATDDQRVGEAFHTAMLEPERFAQEYVVMPAFDGHPNSHAYKAEKAKWQADHARGVHLTASEMASLQRMQKAVLSHPIASRLLSGPGRNEMSIVWRDRPTGLLCKGLLDRLCRVPAGVLNPSAPRPELPVLCLIDLKKSREPGPEPRQFAMQVAKFGYHGQLAMYAEGLAEIEPAQFVPIVIAVDEEENDCVVHRLDEAMEDGSKLYRRLLRAYADCRKTGRWPGAAPDFVNYLTLPKWAKEEEGL